MVNVCSVNILERELLTAERCENKWVPRKYYRIMNTIVVYKP